MSGKIVNDGEMVFLDDIVIFEDEISKPINIPDVPIFSIDELMIFYKGQIFVAQNGDEKSGDRIKVYTQTYKLGNIASPKKQESDWFKQHDALVAQIQKDFITRCVDGITLGSDVGGVLGNQISAELLERIKNTYAGNDKDKSKVFKAIKKNTDVFNTLPASKQSLVLDGKLYDLITVGEYLSGFKKAMEPEFFKTMFAYCQTHNPEEIAHELEANQDKMSPRAIFFIRDKIWNGDGSFEINIGGSYFVPQHVGEVQPVIDEYESRLIEKIKQDAAKAYE